MRALYSCGVLIFVLTNLVVPTGSGPAHRVAWGQQGQPFSAAQIEDLIKNNVSSARLTSLVEERGINFEITAAIKTKLLNAGAENSIIAALEKPVRNM